MEILNINQKKIIAKCIYNFIKGKFSNKRFKLIRPKMINMKNFF